MVDCACALLHICDPNCPASQHGHGRPADIWSLGCCVIEMATAKPPCFDRFSSNPLAFLMWVSNELNTPELPPNEQLRGEWSPEARSFLTRCFHRTPNKRAHAMELMMHPWLVGVVTPTPTAPPVAAAAAQPAVPAVPVPSAPQGPVAVPAVLAPGRQAGAAGVAGASEVVTVDTKAAPQAAVQASVRASVQASIRASVNSRPAPVAGTGAAPVATLPEHSGKSLQPRQPQQGAAEGGRVAIVATSADPSGPQQSLQTGPQPANDREQQESDDWQSGDVGVTATASSLAKLQLGPGRQVEERAGQLPGGFLSGWGEEDEGVHDMVNFGTVMHAGGADTLVNLGSVMMAGEADGRDGAHVRAMGSVAQDAPGVEGVEDGLGMATWASSAMAGSMYNTMFNPMQEPTLMESGAQVRKGEQFAGESCLAASVVHRARRGYITAHPCAAGHIGALCYLQHWQSVHAVHPLTSPLAVVLCRQSRSLRCCAVHCPTHHPNSSQHSTARPPLPLRSRLPARLSHSPCPCHLALQAAAPGQHRATLRRLARWKCRGCWPLRQLWSRWPTSLRTRWWWYVQGGRLLQPARCWMAAARRCQVSGLYLGSCGQIHGGSREALAQSMYLNNHSNAQ